MRKITQVSTFTAYSRNMHIPACVSLSSCHVSAGNEGVAVLDLLSLNPALDPALNPSLTPTVVTVSKTKLKKREQYSPSHLKS